MVTWFADGSVSGFSIDANVTNVLPEAIRDLTRDITHLATNGTIDAEGITRMDYPVSGDSNYRNTLDAVARLKFTSAESAAAGGASRALGATMFVAPATAFAADIIPRPAEIIAAAGVQVYRSYPDSTVVPPNVNTTLPIPGAAQAHDQKLWVLVCPTSYFVGSTPSVANDLPVGDPNAVGRAVSVWTNRRPLAPTIISPPQSSVYGTGTSFDLTFVPNDPDQLFGGDGKAFSDVAGVHVQYAPQGDVGEEAWLDLPITSVADVRYEVPNLGVGWYIDDSINNDPSQDTRSGSFWFWLDHTMKVTCGKATLDSKSGVLPSGDWQIRVRTFDYGHPYPRWKPPLLRVDKDTTPANYAERNASPWSTPVNVSISPQVPPPIAVYPRDNIAVAKGSPLTLRWQFRDTYTPPFGQFRRQVQIREANTGDWITAVSGNQDDTFYRLDDPAPNDDPIAFDPPYEYLTNGDFESPSNSIDGWQCSTGSLSVQAIHPDPPTPALGTKALYQSNLPASHISTIARYVPLFESHKYVTVRGWVFRGSADERLMTIYFYDENNVLLANYARTMETGGGGWKKVVFQDIPVPRATYQVVVAVISSVSDGVLNNAAIDNFSVVGSPIPLGDYPVENGFPFQEPIPYLLSAGKHYEWRVRVVDTGRVASDWSAPASFWVVPDLNSGNEHPVPSGAIEGATLGRGKHTVEIYRRGGIRRVGVLKNVTYVDWGRQRDDMSTAKIVVEDWDIDQGNLLANLESWAYEVVIWRDNGQETVRVWEGPITLPTYENGKVTIHAKDVIAYLYRRIIKQAMNDSGAGHGDTVVNRATRVIQNVLGPDDPNLLAYLTPLPRDDDAKEYRSLPAWSRTAYEEVDDMAANSGLDYTAVGRRILLWGTKHRIGTLPEFTDENLGSSPIVSEYGMSMANVYAVSDGNGVYGVAYRLPILNPEEVEAGEDPIYGEDEDYGLVEMLSSSWASDSESETGTYTEAGLETVRKSFEEYAEQSISDKYPNPVVVRVPDNTTLNPNSVISIQQLVPGVVIPLRSISTLRKVSANQKLDAVRVVEQGGKETISVTMSPFNRDDNATGGEGSEE